MRIDQSKKEELAAKACDMTKRSYAPYSHFHVGAALLCDDGTIFTGCNVENASFGATNCAERTAVFKAVSEGYTHFTAIAIAGGSGGEIGAACPPCGICRQVLSEFCDSDMPVLLAKADGYDEYDFGDVLPLVFDNLNSGEQV